jgi:L-asparagine transporter-like permease
MIMIMIVAPNRRSTKKKRKKKKARSSIPVPTTFACPDLSLCLFCLCVLVLFSGFFLKKFNFLTCGTFACGFPNFRLTIVCFLCCVVFATEVRNNCCVGSFRGVLRRRRRRLLLLVFLVLLLLLLLFFPHTHLQFAEAVVVEGFLLLPLLPHSFLLFLGDGFLSDSSALRSLLQNF